MKSRSLLIYKNNYRALNDDDDDGDYDDDDYDDDDDDYDDDDYDDDDYDDEMMMVMVIMMMIMMMIIKLMIVILIMMMTYIEKRRRSYQQGCDAGCGHWVSASASRYPPKGVCSPVVMRGEVCMR